FAPMVASGYLLQVSVEPLWRTIFLWTHLATSALWVLGYVIHLGRPALAAIRKAKGEPAADDVPRTV
ncbi:MAG: hypothetical protein H6Q89_4151, partial [Myxococcaceae bacterium]|nr:hypothetical protein [Myxococcaceae bacterium]